MKTKAYTVRLNLNVEAERKLYDLLENDSKNYKSASEHIKVMVMEHYNRSNTNVEDIIKQSQKEILDQIYDVCLRIIGAVGGVTVNTTCITETKENVLPKTTDVFPENLEDVLDILVS